MSAWIRGWSIAAGSAVHSMKEEEDSKPSRWQWLGDQVYSFLSRKTKGDPQATVRSLEDVTDFGAPDKPSIIRGLLAWQKVHKDAMGWNSAKKRALNTEVHHPTRNASNGAVP